MINYLSHRLYHRAGLYIFSTIIFSLSRSKFIPNPRVVRATVNTPSLVGCGSSALSLGKGATQEDGELVKQLLSSVGIVEVIPEHLQDAVGALSGSGPAYIYTIIEGETLTYT